MPQKAKKRPGSKVYLQYSQDYINWGNFEHKKKWWKYYCQNTGSIHPPFNLWCHSNISFIPYKRLAWYPSDNQKTQRVFTFTPRRGKFEHCIKYLIIIAFDQGHPICDLWYHYVFVFPPVIGKETGYVIECLMEILKQN